MNMHPYKETPTDINFHPPKVEAFVLSNGIRVHYVQRKKIPVIQLVILLDGGSIYDPAGKEGISVLHSRLVDEGAGPYSALELNDEIEILGSSISVQSNKENTYFGLLSLVENFNRTLELLSLIVSKPSFTETDFIREKNRSLAFLPQIKNYPDMTANIIFDRVVNGEGSPFAHLEEGYIDSVYKIQLEDIKAFNSKIIQPDNMDIIIVGQLDKNEAVSLIEKYFGNLTSQNSKYEVERNFKANSGCIYLYDKPNAEQTEILIGHKSTPRNHADFFPKQIVNKIFGGQFSSRLNSSIREKLGLTYGINSSFRYSREFSDFMISTSVSTDSTFVALEAIHSELSNLKEEISDEEIAFAKNSIIRQFPAFFETNSSILGNLVHLSMCNTKLDSLSSYTDNIKKVSKGEIFEVANNGISWDLAEIVLVGDVKRLLEQINNQSLNKKVFLVDEWGAIKNQL